MSSGRGKEPPDLPCQVEPNSSSMTRQCRSCLKLGPAWTHLLVVFTSHYIVSICLITFMLKYVVMANFLCLGLQQAEDKTNLPAADLHFQGPASNQVQVHIGFLVHSIS